MFHVEHSAMTALERALKLSPTAAAKALERHGRGKDSILAHINPREAELLKALGGSGKKNPKTGLLEFQDEYSDSYASTSAPTPIFGGGSGESSGSGGFFSNLFGGGGGDTSATAPTAPVTSQDLGGSTDAPFSGGAPSGGSFDPSLYPGIFGTPSGSAQQPQAAAAQTTTAPAAPDALGGGLALGTPTAGGTGANPLQSVVGGPDTALGGAGTDQATKPGTKAPPSYGDKLLSSLGGLVAPDNLTKLLGAAIPAGIGLLNNRQAGKQQAAQAQQITNVGAPYTTIGSEQVKAASQGALTPMSAQAYQIAQATAAQDAARRGGVGAQQGAMQVEALRQKLLDNQLSAGLAIQSVGDQYTMLGIKQAISNDQQLNQSTTNFYSQISRMLGGPTGTPAQTGTAHA
jgi:hypothetical protein